ncbi:Gfo/Idh/MocA family oxidoreductase, partial [Streptomyces brasiliscabiei]
HGKHLICEKPVASNIDEATRMFKIAKQNGVVLFEAYKSQFLPNFKQVQLGLEKIGKVHKAHINYCQYSSRYQKYLNGEKPNTFNPAFSN